MWTLALLIISYTAVGQINGCVEVEQTQTSSWNTATQDSVLIDASSCSDDICEIQFSVTNADTIYHSWGVEAGGDDYKTQSWFSEWNPINQVYAGIQYTGDDQPVFSVSSYTTCDGTTEDDDDESTTTEGEATTTEGAATTKEGEATTTEGEATTTEGEAATTTSGPSTTAGDICLLGDYAEGVTTRYWDCCKVSCAWDGKIAGGDDYVDTCESDGTTVLSGNNDQSGCTGGSAYTCTSNMPWAVSDTLAYGYVAAAVPNQDETEFCCGCYHVIFTSEIVGKEMIVQVTNIGYDLSSGGHFDIQMPGGGVGIFDGCSSQWGSGYEWGAQYGGILSSGGSCSDLPSELSEGCEWSLSTGWFEGANNPSMEYAPVECPQELIERSGCERPDWSC